MKRAPVAAAPSAASRVSPLTLSQYLCREMFSDGLINILRYRSTHILMGPSFCRIAAVFSVL